MKVLALIGAVTLALVQAVPASSATETMGGSMAMGGAMAKCSSKDPAVIVNTTKMTYMMDTKSNRMAMRGMMDHDKFVCKSAASKMGAKMKAGSSMMKSGSKM
ncbi:MAG: hypothetical protein NVS2B17_16930 [Candidatus Velthaea sp.]